MLNETETEKHRLFCSFLSLVSFQLGVGPPGPSSWLRLCLSAGPSPWLRLFLSAVPLALCHTVNPALIIALRLEKGEMRT